MRHLGLIIVCVLLGCSGGSSNAPDDDPPLGGGGGGGGDEPMDKDAMCERAMDDAVEAHTASWNAIVAKGAPETLEDMAEAACNLYCGRATECAIDDGCKNAKDVAELDFAKTAPENTRQCIEKCGSWRLTKAQIQSLGSCAQDEDTSCADFLDCTDAAQP